MGAGYRQGVFVVAATGATAGAHWHAGAVGLTLIAVMATVVHRFVLCKRRPAGISIACILAVQLMGHLVLGNGHEPGMVWRHLLAAVLLGLLADRAQADSWNAAARDALLRLFRSRMSPVAVRYIPARFIVDSPDCPCLQPFVRHTSCRAPPVLV